MSQCTVGNRNWCSIDCDSGRCLAYYSEPSGPCVTACLDSDKAKTLSISISHRFSLEMHNIQSEEVQRIFKNLRPDILKALKDTSGEIDVSITDGTMDDLYSAITEKPFE